MGKWIVSGILAAVGAVALFLMPGYHFSGLFLLGLSALSPMYYILGLLQQRYPRLGKWGKRLLSGFLAVLFLCMSITCAIIVDASKGTEHADAQYLIVLGAGVNGTVPSRSLRERLDAALAYLNTHPDSVAIVSGGQGNGEQITEAECMFRYLTAAGIPPERVWKEEQATRTLGNLQLSLALIESRTGARPEKIAIVSSEYHLYRAGLFAGWLELEAQLVPAKTVILPLRWNYFLREIFAVWYYKVFGA